MPKVKTKIILVVEDETPMLTLISEKLSEFGFDVIEAKNGIEGLEKAKKHHPDLILLDLLMPKLDGMKMLSKLREDNWGKNVNVIILTNLSDEEKIREASELNTPIYLMKTDFKLSELVDLINKTLDR